VKSKNEREREREREIKGQLRGGCDDERALYDVYKIITRTSRFKESARAGETSGPLGEQLRRGSGDLESPPAGGA